MDSKKLKRMYNRGYKIGVNLFKGNKTEPTIFVGSMIDVGPLRIGKYKDHKCTTFEISPEGEILTQTMQTIA